MYIQPQYYTKNVNYSFSLKALPLNFNPECHQLGYLKILKQPVVASKLNKRGAGRTA